MNGQNQFKLSKAYLPIILLKLYIIWTQKVHEWTNTISKTH